MRTEERPSRSVRRDGPATWRYLRRRPASVRPHPPQIRADVAPDEERIAPYVRRLDVAVYLPQRPRLVEASPQPAHQ